MTVKEKLDTEKRNADTLYEIYFYLEGGFWRAYEWSAYLSKNFPSNLTENERFKVTKRAMKYNPDGYTFIGLQMPSFNKYFPRVMENEKLFEIDDKTIIIHAKEFFKDKDFTSYEKILKDWKESLPFKETKEEKSAVIYEKKVDSASRVGAFAPDVMADTDILKEIMAYPIERKSLIESVAFLSRIKERVTKKNKK